MSDDEIADFEKNPFYKEGVALRRIDDEAKVAGLSVPSIDTYRGLAERLATA
ncbi:MAG: hypothetical protein AAFW47_07795 [Pseudomonadota bacterium]